MALPMFPGLWQLMIRTFPDMDCFFEEFDNHRFDHHVVQLDPDQFRCGDLPDQFGIRVLPWILGVEPVHTSCR